MLIEAVANKVIFVPCFREQNSLTGVQADEGHKRVIVEATNPETVSRLGNFLLHWPSNPLCSLS